MEDARYFKALRNTSFYAFLSLALVLPVAVVFAHALQAWEVVCDLSCNLSCSFPGWRLPPCWHCSSCWCSRRQGAQSVVCHSVGKAADQLAQDRYSSYGAHHAMCLAWLGFMTFFIHSGMQAIPGMYYEALEVETHKAWHRFRGSPFHV